MSAEKPIGVALVICDQIIEDSTSKKRSLIGLFNSVQCTDFPATLHKVCVFTSITQLNGNYEVELRCTNETTKDVVISAKGNAGSTDPNTVLEIGFEFASFCFPRPGLYGFEFLCDGEIILCTRFNVFRVSNK